MICPSMCKRARSLPCWGTTERAKAPPFHRGSYSTFSESYETVLRYIEENGYEIDGEIRESYIDGIWNRDDESEWLSEIQVPVRKKAK